VARVNQHTTFEHLIGDIDAVRAARLAMAGSDVALILDDKGVIREVGVDGTKSALSQHWPGRKWVDTVTVESRGKVEELLREVRENGSAKFREINHRMSDGTDLPIRYSGVQIGNDRIVAIGRDLSLISSIQQRLVEAQRNAEQEFLRLRSAETRYRILFQMAEEAILVLDANTLKTIDANPSAAALLEATPGKLVGHAFGDFFSPDSWRDLAGQFEGLRAVGRFEAQRATLASAGPCWVSASLFRQDVGAQILVRLTPTVDRANAALPAVKEQSLHIIDKLPHAFLVLDTDGRILDANASFLDMAGLPSTAQARGQMINRWLGRASVDANVLFSNLREHGSVRDFATVMQGEYGTAEDVEISGAAVGNGETLCYGLIIHSLARRRSARPALGDPARTADQLAELVGRMPLKDLVRETTEITERLCIATSLKLTGDNRAAAAQMLGLSRQSLYDKLRRYDMGDLGRNGDSDD